MMKINTSGSAGERGRQQGAVVRDMFEPWMRRMQEIVRQAGNPAAWERETDRRRRALERVYPEGYQECLGIAAGLGVAEAKYFRTLFAGRIRTGLPHCTVAGFRMPAGQTLMGKTDDIGASDVGRKVLEITSPDRGYWHLHFHHAGTIWTIAGMNERGLAIAMTGIPGPTREADGLRSLDALHTILPACATVPETEAHVRTLRLNDYGFSLLVGDAEGRLSLLEKTAVGMSVLPAQAHGCFAHTNHILDPEFARQNPPQSEPVNANGRRRLDNVLRLLHSLPRTEAGLTALLHDRSPPGAIHQQGEDGLYSDLRVLFRPRLKSLTYWADDGQSVESETLDLAVTVHPKKVAARGGPGR